MLPPKKRIISHCTFRSLLESRVRVVAGMSRKRKAVTSLKPDAYRPLAKAKVGRQKPQEDTDVQGDWHCSICCLPGTLMMCDGACGRCFHPECLNLEEVPEGLWECELCKLGKRECFECKRQIQGPVVKCTAAGCRLVFDENCARRFCVEGDALKALRCPRHVCRSCGDSIQRGTRISLKPVRCILCTRAWHTACAPWSIITHLDIDSKDTMIGICDAHPMVGGSLCGYLPRDRRQEVAKVMVATQGEKRAKEVEDCLEVSELQAAVLPTRCPDEWKVVFSAVNSVPHSDFQLSAAMAQRGGGAKPAPFTLIRKSKYVRRGACRPPADLWRVPQPPPVKGEDVSECTCKPGPNGKGCTEGCINRELKA